MDAEDISKYEQGGVRRRTLSHSGGPRDRPARWQNKPPIDKDLCVGRLPDGNKTATGQRAKTRTVASQKDYQTVQVAGRAGDSGGDSPCPGTHGSYRK